MWMCFVISSMYFFFLHSNIINKIRCYAHPDAPLIDDYSAGDMICSECGLVVVDRCIDVGAEWRTFSNDSSGKSGNEASRCGSAQNPLLNGGNLYTTIAGGSRSNYRKYF